MLDYFVAETSLSQHYGALASKNPLGLQTMHPFYTMLLLGILGLQQRGAHGSYKCLQPHTTRQHVGVAHHKLGVEGISRRMLHRLPCVKHQAVQGLQGFSVEVLQTAYHRGCLYRQLC